MFNKNAELLNGRLAMLGIVAAIGAYALTGQVIPGIWWWDLSLLPLYVSLHLRLGPHLLKTGTN